MSDRENRWKHIMPIWANGFFCNEARALVWLRQQITGVPFALDHIIPVVHPYVCGLHVENNLQVIPRLLNSKKSSRVAYRFKWSEFFRGD